MPPSTTQPHFPGAIVRWTARIWSILSISFLLMMFIGEGLCPKGVAALSTRDLAGMLFFPVGTCIGMIIAWWRELIGGIITVVSFAAFYGALYIMDGRVPRGPWFLIVAAPGILFLLSWALNARRHEKNVL